MANHNNPHIAAFIALFNQTARYHHRYEVFRDFVQMAACAVHNQVVFSPPLEDEYLGLVKQYERDDVNRMGKLLGILRCGLGLQQSIYDDVLGRIFMSLELGDTHRGQFFTPFHISRMMAMLTVHDLESRLEQAPFLTVGEPACGSGGMVIAVAEQFSQAGYPPSHHLFASCVDIDPVASAMCFLQLALLQIPAEVITGNSLTAQYRRVLRTPAYYLHGWPARLESNEKSVVAY
ncbi:Type I restriction-modification system methyltransferase subunit [Serratia entomophila]|uniref:N-6 DNA methylase n=1 Tax=Serratia entomophila TaxID=42906 RepID=UPI002178E2F5|nr:N-6 DNA methylase [Serratia entomophila]CAI1906037.1 Type I restriction-modification system methyltransferase subunit [Serratia entomophila]